MNIQLPTTEELLMIIGAKEVEIYNQNKVIESLSHELATRKQEINTGIDRPRTGNDNVAEFSKSDSGNKRTIPEFLRPENNSAEVRGEQSDSKRVDRIT